MPEQPRRPYSQWSAMLAIARASFLSITRSPSAVVFTLAFPMVFILVFGFIGGGGFRVDLGLLKGSDKQNDLYRALDGSGVFRFVENDDSVMRLDLARGTIDALLSIRPEAGRPGGLSVELLTSAAAPEGGRFVDMVIENIVQRLNIDEAQLEHPRIALVQQQVTGRKYRTIDFILPGQLGFALLSNGVFGTAFVFFNLRQTLVLKRFFATPMRRPYIILGEAIARMVFALLGALVIVAIGHLAFGFTLIHGLITLGAMLLLSALGLLVFMGFGFIVSGLARNESAIPPLANIITLPQFLLSGTFFSISLFPAWLQPVCKVLPLTYLNHALRKVAFEGAGLAAIATDVLIIAGWGILVYLVAFRTFRWE